MTDRRAAIFPAASLRWQPWKNGGGVAADIAAHPAGASHAQAFEWRIGLAEIAVDGPFSDYPGYDRLFAVVAGMGVAFAFGTAAPGVTALPFQVVPFAGEWPTQCRLLDGPVTALNLIWARGRWRAGYRIGGAELLAPSAGPAATRGFAVALDDGLILAGQPLRRFDAIPLDRPVTGPVSVPFRIARLDIAPLTNAC